MYGGNVEASVVNVVSSPGRVRAVHIFLLKRRPGVYYLASAFAFQPTNHTS